MTSVVYDRDTAPVIEGTQLCKAFGVGEAQRTILKDASVRVHRGEFVAIVGPSGSGKSTLLNLLGCLDRATAGIISIDGRRIDSLSPAELARLRNQRMGFVFQSPHLMPKATALDNVGLPLVYAGLSRKERMLRAEEVLVQLGLADRLRHLPSQLSGGQQQRVAIARALAARPGIVLADEPTGSLDSRSSEAVLVALRGIADDGVTVVMVTHDSAIAGTADRRIHVHDGQIVNMERKSAI